LGVYKSSGSSSRFFIAITPQGYGSIWRTLDGGCQVTVGPQALATRVKRRRASCCTARRLAARSSRKRCSISPIGMPTQP